MNCCSPYTIPKICETSGSTQLIQLVYVKPEGSPISLTGATINYTISLAMDNSTVKTANITTISTNTCEFTLDTTGLNGNYIITVTATLSNGQVMIDKGMVVVYGG